MINSRTLRALAATTTLCGTVVATGGCSDSGSTDKPGSDQALTGSYTVSGFDPSAGLTVAGTVAFDGGQYTFQDGTGQVWTGSAVRGPGDNIVYTPAGGGPSATWRAVDGPPMVTGSASTSSLHIATEGAPSLLAPGGGTCLLGSTCTDGGDDYPVAQSGCLAPGSTSGVCGETLLAQSSGVLDKGGEILIGGIVILYLGLKSSFDWVRNRLKTADPAIYDSQNEEEICWKGVYGFQMATTHVNNREGQDRYFYAQSLRQTTIIAAKHECEAFQAHFYNSVLKNKPAHSINAWCSELVAGFDVVPRGTCVELSGDEPRYSQVPPNLWSVEVPMSFARANH